jgi:hypothetical protein
MIRTTDRRCAPRGRCRERRTSVAVCLLTAALLRVVLPAVDTRAIEHDPYHLHVVIGGTPVQRAEAMARHRQHGHGAGSHRGIASVAQSGLCGWPDDPDGRRPRVLSVVPSAAWGTTVLSAAGLSIAVPESPREPTITWPAGRLAATPETLPLRIFLSVPDPPPRGTGPA